LGIKGNAPTVYPRTSKREKKMEQIQRQKIAEKRRRDQNNSSQCKKKSAKRGK